MALKDFLEGRSPNDLEKEKLKRKKNKTLLSADGKYEKAQDYMKKHMEEEAINQFYEALFLYESEQDWIKIINCEIFMGLIKNQSNLEEANKHFLKAIEITLTKFEYWAGIPAFEYLGKNLRKQGKLDLALYNLDIGYKLAAFNSDSESKDDIMLEINFIKALKNGQHITEFESVA